MSKVIWVPKTVYGICPCGGALWSSGDEGSTAIDIATNASKTVKCEGCNKRYRIPKALKPDLKELEGCIGYE